MIKNLITKLSCLFCLVFLFSCKGTSQGYVTIPIVDFETKMNSGNYQVLDVRTSGEFKSGYLKGAVQADWLNKKEFEERTKHLNTDKPLLVYCASGVRSEQAAKWLLKKGFKEVYNLKGGTSAWKIAGKEFEASTTTAQMTIPDFEKKIKDKIGQFQDIPILFVSALTKQRILKAVEVAMQVYEDRKKKIKTSKLNEIMLPIFEGTPPPANKGKYIKIKYCVQLPTPSPQFVFFCNLPQYVKEPYKRFTENQLRKEFGFTGVPIEVYFRQK